MDTYSCSASFIPSASSASASSLESKTRGFKVQPSQILHVRKHSCSEITLWALRAGLIHSMAWCHDSHLASAVMRGWRALLSGRSHPAPKALQLLCRWKHPCCCLTVPTGILYFILHPRQLPQPWLCGAFPSADIHSNWSPAQGGVSRVTESLPSFHTSPTSKWAAVWFPSESASFGLGYTFLPPFVPFFQPITSTFATDTLALLMLLT